ncbi:MAG: hypothetical protein ACD_52C00257G0010 [uncultured bacterium]|uniref:DNA repair protein RecO n=1 Tax=Candidatus Woesebacteria bacterium RIFCSPHIGHO2_12_FULL_41_24 TaxID=1802510 RepID=A0A1F8ARC4_9BACT|nr:MAG: hypothetical protein ACD_52C00257G0010 [uncultured bacterium]OGM13240.1 MAG: DNA repair protein RecO [Candidatus Woesebacteria bacterium RBG_16_41_13]OGM30642.1 MAG: DNA repair protein RecO [Candidatus Woesebacteria bacterium RIFCSPHIGHO2_01_FULL_42_80]OGM35779.1 MAG: DNA repair protein RecO [Candidatus Woesebacteria bacterium RIFCSPHIGHO2_02_FULL_42_20]OGM53838.1 MAG: DNA repair protein RecO [Candidatus Woesebacteria bacterium RIFCSPHIGHO2_12_FULL_41_24]OGM66030.1 MAG: DNA repair prot
MQRYYKLEAIVLSKKRIGEADSLVKVYSRQMGKTTLLAKGVRKPTSRKRGSLDNFSHVALSVASSKGIDIITETKLIHSFAGWKKDLKKVSIAYFFCEVVDKLTGEAEKNEVVYTYLLDTFKLLESVKGLRSQRDMFSKKILVLLGFWEEVKDLTDPDEALKGVVEREIFSLKIGKKILN